MIRISFFSAAVAILMLFCQASSAHAAAPEEQLIEAVKVALGKNFNTDWSGLDALPGGSGVGSGMNLDFMFNSFFTKFAVLIENAIRHVLQSVFL
jgi:hypothetical protein